MKRRLGLGAEAVGSRVQLDPTSRVLFLSDLHFGDGTKTDLFADQDARLMTFLEEQRGSVDAIVFLGDILDMPQAWSPRRVFRAHPKLMRYLRRLVREERIVFVRGNHDWSVDYEGLFPGAERSEAVLLGEGTLAWHGHQVDLLMHPGVVDATAKTYVHAMAERMVGTRLVPPLERYDSRANRIALTMAVAFARFRVTQARMLRTLGRRERAGELEASVRYLARSVCGDPADIYGATTRDVLGSDYRNVLCGHSHVPGVARTERGVYANTGTWASGMRTFALWNGECFVVRDVDTGREIADEHYRSVPCRTEPQDLFDWWTEQWHRGLFR